MTVDYSLELSEITLDRMIARPDTYTIKQCLRYLLIVDGVKRSTTMDTLNELMFNNKNEFRKAVKDMLEIAENNIRNYAEANNLKCLEMSRTNYVTSTGICCICTIK